MCTVVLAGAALLSLLAQGVQAADERQPAADQAQQAPTGGFTILITNDDGIDHAGINELANALRPLGRIVVAAPTGDQSGTGSTLPGKRHQMTVAKRTDEGGVTWYGVDATPAACVLLAATTLMTRSPDLVVSGMNSSPNLGQSVYDSGTVGASRAAAWLGVPAISMSVDGNNRERYRAAADFTRRFIERLRADGAIRPGLLLKVSWPRDEPKGLRITRISDRYAGATFEPCPGAADGGCYMVRRQRHSGGDGPDTDMGALAAGFVSITPLELDVTASGPHGGLKGLEGIWDQLAPR